MVLSWLVQFMWLLPGRCGQVVSPAAVYRQEIPTCSRPHYWWVYVLFCKFKFAMFTVRCTLFSLLYGPSHPLSPSPLSPSHPPLSLPSSLSPSPPLSPSPLAPPLLSSFFSSLPSPSLYPSLHFLRGGVWSTNDQHWWEADQTTNLGHGKLCCIHLKNDILIWVWYLTSKYDHTQR